jgi:hypothetical protein
MVSEKHRRYYEHVLSLSELSTVLQKRVGDRVYGLDEFSCEFYKATW